MTKEEWIKIYNAKDGTWDKDVLIDKAYEIITSPTKTNYDCIKSMNVEEMANFLEINGSDDFHMMTDEAQCRICEKRGNCNGDCNFLDTYGVKEWLLQEVSDE
jgi:radical SAM protein with 4Fe4S-binding SPASM domain